MMVLRGEMLYKIETYSFATHFGFFPLFPSPGQKAGRAVVRRREKMRRRRCFMADWDCQEERRDIYQVAAVTATVLQVRPSNNPGGSVLSANV